MQFSSLRSGSQTESVLTCWHVIDGGGVLRMTARRKLDQSKWDEKEAVAGSVLPYRTKPRLLS